MKRYKVIIILSDSYQEIEVALTEMESCMKLLFPAFDLTDIQSSQQRLQSASESAAEQPCCSRDLVSDWNEAMRKERQEEKNSAEGKGNKDGHVTDQEERRRHIEDGGGKEIEEDEETEEEGHSEDEHDSFIRGSGLISHSYSLDLNISSGGFKD